MTQTETEQGTNRPANIQLQSKTKRRYAQEVQELNDQIRQNDEEGPRI